MIFIRRKCKSADLSSFNGTVNLVGSKQEREEMKEDFLNIFSIINISCVNTRDDA